MINNSRFNFFLKVSLALLSFLFLLLSCTGTTNTDSTSNSSKVAITGIFTYTPLDIEQGTVTNTSPTWTGALANQTVTYTMVRQGEEDMPASIIIDSSTGVVNLTTNAVVSDSGTYIITASGSDQYNDTKQTTLTIILRLVGATLTTVEGSFSYNNLTTKEGTRSTANPTWSGALAGQTVTYGIVRQGGASLPASITIDSSTGTVSLAASAIVADSGTYTITVTGTGNYQGNTTADIAINITKSIQGTLTYGALNVIKGTESTVNPTWSGALANQTVTYGIIKQGGANLPASITIDSSTGIISVETNVGFQDGGDYTVTATGTGNYRGNATVNLVITITMVINTAAELQAITNNIFTLESVIYSTSGTAPPEVQGRAAQYIGGNYELAQNIDLSKMTNFIPIGNRALPFIGVFDGKGHRVTVNINGRTDYVGFFSYVGINEGEVNSENKTAARERNSAIEIKNIEISGTVTGSFSTAGGLVGKQNGGTVIGYSEATVVAKNDVAGGLVGQQLGGTIIGYTTGNVSATYSTIGGLLGRQDGGTLIGYATGNVSGRTSVGGLVGQQYGGTATGYATGTVSGATTIGGLVGQQYGGTATGYAIGTVSGTDVNIKGFVGSQRGTIQGGYFDATATGQTDTAATNISAAANIYKFTGPTETDGRTVGKFYDKATGTSATAEDSGDTEIFTVQEFIDAFDLGNTPNGRFPKLKTSLFGTFPQP